MSVNREPVAIAGAVRAVLVCIAAFGAGLSGEQVAAVVVALETVLGLLVRQNVTPTADPNLGGDAGQATFWPGVLVGVGVTLAWLAFFGPR